MIIQLKNYQKHKRKDTENTETFYFNNFLPCSQVPQLFALAVIYKVSRKFLFIQILPFLLRTSLIH